MRLIYVGKCYFLRVKSRTTLNQSNGENIPNFILRHYLDLVIQPSK